MQEELENWLIFSHCRVFTRRWQFYGNWNSGKDWTLLEQLSEKTDKNILVYDANESGGYYPLAGAQSDNLLELIHKYSHPDNKIWFSNGDYYAQRNYEEWCKLTNRNKLVNMHPVIMSSARDIFANRYNEHPIQSNREKKYKIICMVNQPKLSRVLTLRELAGLPGFIYSFNGTEINELSDDGSSSDDSFNHKVSRLNDWNFWTWSDTEDSIIFNNRDEVKVYENFSYDLSTDNFNQKQRISFRTDHPGIPGDNDAYHDYLPVREWEESEIELINETYQDKAFSFTDKVCKAIGHKKPFILIGCQGWYKAFREIGFHTYDELFDHSFDDISSFKERHEAIIELVKHLLKTDISKSIIDIHEKLEYNKQHMLNYREDMDAYIKATEINNTCINHYQTT